ncbi:MAG: tRNA (adenosine(37)-N6)-threonylcarbamoyltransferase complex transferase subunit TsaD [Blastochloris viridis]|uniref:tRNA N6-adenosine threonylcarbamoyltransferase n=1 Tax=Blastochloris viridis TaxID=1079 RepID=A0A6N4RCQ6_BLAVI|nr:MAG: tRNA (adenosine(37)-N6)-threonylcarbamoyltransferase complex transferase subunit TsaD [Blastochloris viridis]
MSPNLVFAIETSCDETATAIVDVSARRILAQSIYSQYTEHAPYGGVVPELASRAHLERLPHLANHTLQQAGLQWNDIDAIAATVGPGLTTALVVGATFAKTLAVGLGKPFLATNHIEGHALSPLLAENSAALAEAFLEHDEPYLLLLVTGGHTQLIQVTKPGHYTTLGTTQDDAVGEAFDKVGKLLGLPHPAGPAIEKLAATGNASAVQLPHPKTENPLGFSFSGLKTAVREYLTKHPDVVHADLAASFQTTVATLLARKTAAAIKATGSRHVVVAGGVAANATIRQALMQVCEEAGTTFTAPPLILCTDNAAMIAYAAGIRAHHGLDTGSLSTRVLPRWPLEDMAKTA